MAAQLARGVWRQAASIFSHLVLNVMIDGSALVAKSLSVRGANFVTTGDGTMSARGAEVCEQRQRNLLGECLA